MAFGIKLPIKLPSPPTIPKIVSSVKPNLINVATSNKLPLVAKALSMVTPRGATVAVAGLVIQNKDVIKTTLGGAGNTVSTVVQKVTAPITAVVKKTETTLASAAVKVESTVKSGASTLESGVKKVGGAVVGGMETMMYVGLGGAAVVVLILLLK